jgi:hypothetical protein
MAVFSDKDEQKPYILGFYPHWAQLGRDDCLPPLDVAKLLIASFKDVYKYTPHVVMDARFAMKDILPFMQVFSTTATFALPTTHEKYLFTVLSRGVGAGQWRCATTPDGKIASFMRVRVKDSLTEWRVMGYGWKVNRNSFVQKSAFSLEDFAVMTKLSDTALLSLVLGLGGDGTGGRSDWMQYITKLSPSDRQRLENEKSAAAQNDSFFNLYFTLSL